MTESLKAEPAFGLAAGKWVAFALCPVIESDGQRLPAGDKFKVYDKDGNLLGLSFEIDGHDMFVLPIMEVPDGATSGAWEGPYGSTDHAG